MEKDQKSRTKKRVLRKKSFGKKARLDGTKRETKSSKGKNEKRGLFAKKKMGEIKSVKKRSKNPWSLAQKKRETLPVRGEEGTRS